MRISVAISPGELLDKLTILEIKQERIGDPAKRANIGREKAVLEAAASALIGPEIAGLKDQLKSVNEELWQIEDEIRICDRGQDFGPRFIELARSVYITNDRRAALKKQINDILGSDIPEEKSYSDY